MEEYVNQQVSEDISLKDKLEQIDVFTRERTNSTGSAQRVNGIPEINNYSCCFSCALSHTESKI